MHHNLRLLKRELKIFHGPDIFSVKSFPSSKNACALSAALMSATIEPSAPTLTAAAGGGTTGAGGELANLLVR